MKLLHSPEQAVRLLVWQQMRPACTGNRCSVPVSLLVISHSQAQTSQHLHRPISRVCSATASQQSTGPETHLHRDLYFSFGGMGKRSRKARKRELQNQPGRGFPHQVEDAASDAVVLAVDLGARVIALTQGRQLTVFDARYVSTRALSTTHLP